MSSYRTIYNNAKRQFVTKFKKEIDKQIAQIVKGQEVTGDGIRKTIRRLHSQLGTLMAHRAVMDIRRQSNLKATPQEIWRRVILLYLEQFGLDKLVEEITNTTKTDILEILTRPEFQELNPLQIMAAIEKLGYSQYRAERITRTETAKSANTGAVVGALSTGLETVKEWNRVGGDRTRRTPRDEFNHLSMEGQTVKMDGYFDVPMKNGGSEKLLHPGDPNASAGNVINCFLPDQLTSVNRDHIEKVYRSFYEGDVITVQLADGSNFTCTPNHPILTADGWVGAGMLTNKSQLIYSSVINDNYCPHFNVNNSKSSFEQIYNSLSEVWHRVRKSGAVMDFYGDGSAGNVDIVVKERFLRNGAEVGQFISNKIFEYSDLAMRFLLGMCGKMQASVYLFFTGITHTLVSFRNNLFSILNACLGHSYKHAFAAIPGSDTHFIQSKTDRGAGTSKISGQFFDTHTGFIEGFNFREGVSGSQVVSIRHSDYKGFVFTFETVNQMYDINSFVAKNCRCWVSFIVQRDSAGRPKKMTAPPIGNAGIIYNLLKTQNVIA